MPNAKIAVIKMYIATTCVMMPAIGFSVTTAPIAKYDPIKNAVIIRLGRTSDNILSQPSQKFFLRKNNIIIEIMYKKKYL